MADITKKNTNTGAIPLKAPTNKEPKMTTGFAYFWDRYSQDNTNNQTYNYLFYQTYLIPLIH